MSNDIYCIEKMKGNQTVMEVAISDNMHTKKSLPSKRVDIVSIRMIKESSILYKNRKVNSPTEAYNLITEFLKDYDREHLIVCSLDTKNQPTNINVVSIGTLNSSLVHPREVFKPAILSNAASIIIYHNHPSGDPSASSEDVSVTQRIKECGKLLGIDLIDHIIIGDERFVSLKEKGVI